jgi:predicted DNA binding CopG/RHH family protein
MIKSYLKDMPLLFIHISQSDKDALTAEATKKGMRLTTYCRMILLDTLKERGN